MKFNDVVNCLFEYSNVKIADQYKDKEVSGISINSKTCKEDFIFVAYKGEIVDSHNFIMDAYEHGARFFVINYVPFALESMEDVSYVVVKDSRVSLALITKIMYNYNDEVNLIGVTGTNGKTSTTHFINQLLLKSGLNVGSIGTLGVLANDKPVDKEISGSTTPEYVELMEILKYYKEHNIDNCVMEVSSHALELKKVFNLKFKAAIFTNLTQDHLDFHKTMDNYFLAKAKLFNMCDIGFVNADDEWCDKLKGRVTCDCYTFSVEKDSDFKAYDVKVTNEYVEFTVDIRGKAETFRLNITGTFTVYNALGSILVAMLAYNIPADVVRRELLEITGVPGRLQSVPNNKGINVIVDYAHTPDALENVISSIRKIGDGEIITVFGCGGDRDKTKRPIMANVATSLSDYTVITSDNPRSEDPSKIVTEVALGAKDDSKFITIVDRREAIKHAIENAKKGDFVIICGKGHETYQILKDETIHFDDAEVARELLK